MKLQRRTLLIVSLLMLTTLASVQLVGRLLIYPSFIALEQEQARRNAERVIEVINRELALLSPTCEDWSYWDETYDFTENLNNYYLRTNLTQANQISLKVNLLGFYDRQGRRLWARGMDFASQQSFPLDEFSRERLPIDYPLLSHEDIPKVRVGLLNTAHGPLLAVSSPILTSVRTGPSRGTMIMGRFLDTEAIGRIAQQTLLRIDLRQTRSSQPTTGNLDAHNQRIPHTAFKFETLPKSMRASTTLAGIDGRPLLDLIIDTPREVSARGRAALRVSMICIALAGLTITLTLLWLLNNTIVLPLAQLTELARNIGADDDLRTRLRLQRQDEIGELGNEFDRMLDRMADARQRLLNESHHSGMNEMASGVVNDLRESLGPLREQLEQPLRLLDRAQMSGQQLLLHELSGSTTSHHRQSEIIQQLLDQTNEHSVLLAEARSELRGIRKGLEHLQGIVTEYSRFVAGSNTLEPVLLGDLIEHCLRNMPSENQQALLIEIDGSVERAPPVLAAREILQQVVNVLIDQSAASQPVDAQARRQLRITASSEYKNSRSMVHFRFDDNRPTLAPEEIATLFNREWQASAEMHGLSLSWAENTISAMGGKLYAEASQPFDGLVLHLLLARAKNIDG